MIEGGKGRYIKQIRLAGHKSYFPNKYYSPYDFMDRLNEAVKGRYDLTVIEVRYIISKPFSIQARARPSRIWTTTSVWAILNPSPISTTSSISRTLS